MPHDINKDLAGNAIIGVDEDVPNVRHGAPRDLRVGQAKRVIESARCLADDLQVAANRIGGPPARSATKIRYFVCSRESARSTREYASGTGAGP